jgi:DnaK suppressor protein
MAEKALRAHLADLEGRLGVLTKPPEKGTAVGFGKRVGDGTTEAVSRLTDVGVADSFQVSMERIERALAKLEEGTYGACDVCHGQIALPRLRAAPESAVCIDCARLTRR